MNGEVYELCEIVLHANRALSEAGPIEPLAERYVKERRFVFSQSFGFANSLEQWFEISRKRGLSQIMILLPTRVSQRSILGFANTSQGCAMLFRDDSSISVLSPQWTYLPEERKWRVVYREQEWNKKPFGIPEFIDPRRSFDYALKEIGEFARALNQPYFENVFSSARDILSGKEEDAFPGSFAGVGKARKCYLNAASKADVFGGMGSWNDTPAGYAKQLGRGKDYERLSDELLKQIRLAVMYGVNHSFDD